jgi:hypothetical protein
MTAWDILNRSVFEQPCQHRWFPIIHISFLLL